MSGKSPYTSFYLHDDTREKLDRLVEASGKSRSQVVSGLIHAAGAEKNLRIIEITRELNELVLSE